MSTRLTSGVARLVLTAMAFVLLAPESGIAGVRSTTEFRAYVVGGTTAGSLVSYMRRRPFRGDYGPAVANIRPNYTLSIDTTFSDAVCSVRDVDLNINFVMTLP